jgi:hypothetical protein
MPLFGGERDISMLKKVGRELVWNIVTQQVAFYKLLHDKTHFNIYGEASGVKFYTDPILVNCLIERGEQNYVETEFGPDLQWNHNFRFLKDDLELANVLPEIGDIVLYETGFYELTKIVANQLFLGKNPDKAFKDQPYSQAIDKFGYDVSVICYGVYTPKDKVGIDLTERIL